MAPQRTARRAYPDDQFAPMKWVNIKDLWYEAWRRAVPDRLLGEALLD